MFIKFKIGTLKGIIKVDAIYSLWMEFLHLLTAIEWPVAAIAITLILRKEICAAIRRIEKVQTSGGALSFGQLPTDRRSLDNGQDDTTAQSSNGEKAIGSMDKVGNIYWLGNDLMWTVNVILRNGPLSQVSHGIRQTYHHLAEAGLANTSLGKQVFDLREQIGNDIELTIDQRKEIATRLTRVGCSLGHLISAQQPDFKNKS